MELLSNYVETAVRRRSAVFDTGYPFLRGVHCFTDEEPGNYRT